MGADLKIGDRVEIVTAPTAPHGTVEHVDSEHVRVRWDDGQVGLLYHNDRMIPNARYLVRLATGEYAPVLDALSKMDAMLDDDEASDD